MPFTPRMEKINDEMVGIWFALAKVEAEKLPG